MTLEKKVYEGNKAAEILNNPVFVEVFEDIEKELYQEWKSSPARDAAGREKIWAYLQILNKIKGTLTQTFETGKLANLELEHKRTLFERAREMISFDSE